MPALCAYPACPHTARARGYCVGHHRQLLRAGGDASALRTLRPEGPALVNATIRLAPATAAAVREDTPGARVALDKWAKRQRKA